MAVIQKTLFAKNLDKYAVLVNDTEPNSRYFKITELPDTFTGGKNAFLVAGSQELVPDTKIQIELKDSAGNIIYHEPGEGYFSSSFKDNNNKPIITEYYEGVSKVVSVYIYPDTSYGPCTLTILGELSEYQDTNGITLPVPLDWENKYNVKWTKTINVNPALANTTKIRFYQRPQATITELLSPLYRIENDLKVASAVTQSFANIKLSKLETFAGDVKRIKVFRTSEGDISDYDLIQDILVESKELLTSYGLSGSVVGQTGILTSETLKNNWNTGSLNAYLTSSRVESGVRLTGSGYFTYSSSLDIKSSNTYELNLDAFYSSSTSSNLGIYLNQITTSVVNGVTVPTTISSSISTLIGTQPTKNLLDTVIPFRIDRNYPSASLYFSQSQGEWHLGNISLRLSQDTAFSPDEISFVTTMPTVLGNETYNFKFEFYDVNNNYVPVAVTQSALFTGGNNNINGTLTLISSSASGSLADLNRVSSSISGTVTLTSSSISGTLGTISGSVSGSITSLSSSVSGTISSLSSSVSSSNVFILSSSLSKVQQLANGQFSGSFIGDTFIYSPTIGGQQGYISELFKVGEAPSIYLDARQNPRKIFIGGVSDSGSYNNSNTTVYMDSTGKFSLGNQLSFNGSALTVNGTINVTGGNAATDENALLYASRAVTSGSVSASAAQTAAELFAASAAGRAVLSGSVSASAAQQAAIAQAISDASASINLLANGNWTAGSGTFITSRSISSPVIAANAGYISGIFKVGLNGITLDGISKKIFVGTGNYNNSDTPFYFASGSTNVFSLGDKLTFNGVTLAVNGSITATNITATTAGNIAGWGVSATTLGTTNLKLNSARPAIEIYNAGALAVDISSATSLSSLVTGTGTVNNIPYATTTQLQREDTFDTTELDVYQVDIGADPLFSTGGTIATFTAPSAGAYNVNITLGGTVSNALGMLEPNGVSPQVAFSYLNAFCTIGVSIRAVSTSGTEIANFSYYNDWSQVRSGLNFNVSTTPNPTLVGSINLTSGVTYYMVPYIAGGGMSSITTNGNLDTHSLRATYTTPTITAVSIAKGISKSELVAGGFQVVFSTDRYCKIERANNADFVSIGGGLTCTGDVTANTSSDKRWKDNIIPIENPIEKIKKLTGNSFVWKDGFEVYHSNKGLDYGVIAQEVEEVMPEIVIQRDGGYKGVRYEKIIPLLIEAIKEQQKQIEELKNNR
jgi:hypothetical protein